MSKREYSEKLIQVVGSSLYYYTHMKEIDVTSRHYADFEQLTEGWIKEYRGEWNLNDPIIPLQLNMFKPMVDQIIHQIMEATEDEIQRRFAEQWDRYQNKLDKRAKED